MFLGFQDFTSGTILPNVSRVAILTGFFNAINSCRAIRRRTAPLSETEQEDGKSAAGCGAVRAEQPLKPTWEGTANVRNKSVLVCCEAPACEQCSRKKKDSNLNCSATTVQQWWEPTPLSPLLPREEQRHEIREGFTRGGAKRRGWSGSAGRLSCCW